MTKRIRNKRKINRSNTRLDRKLLAKLKDNVAPKQRPHNQHAVFPCSHSKVTLSTSAFPPHVIMCSSQHPAGLRSSIFHLPPSATVGNTLRMDKVLLNFEEGTFVSEQNGGFFAIDVGIFVPV